MTDLRLPDAFRRRIVGAFGEHGERWLATLPQTVARYRKRWSLTDLRALESPSYAWVGFAQSPRGAAVLKLNVPNPEAVSEAAALAAFPASACCRLLTDDRDAGALLLERLDPGTPLRETASFRERLEVAGRLFATLHDRPTPTTEVFPRYRDQAQRTFGRTAVTAEAARTAPSARSVLTEMAEKGRRLLAGLEAISAHSGETLLHADLHHDNMLRAGARWKIIDPKGTVGPRALEAGRFVINQFGDAPEGERHAQFVRMVESFATALAVPRSQIALSAALDAAVSASWSVEEGVDGDLEEEHAGEGGGSFLVPAERALVIYEWSREFTDSPPS